ncbi:MAG TPA: DUF2971 domain-containing protein [Thermoanaerobaculia bacterium]|jgi:hypothetical protein|nr:DUF2971 domain-containing protein [Thermoanaerobaculia bacterium]
MSQIKERKLIPPPTFLFRYRPPEEVTLGYFEGLLRNNHIWASPPRGFIDSQDCRAQIDFKLTREEMHRYWVGNFKMLGKKGLEASKAANRVLASLAWKDPGKLEEIIQKIQKTLDNSGIICLTDTALDRRVWEEYAGGHRGVCLCFETSGSPFSTARYVNYMVELPIVKISADSGEKVEAFLLTKGSSYSWEREWRFVDYNKGGGYKPILPKALRAVVFGSQAEETIRQEVTRLIAQWKPDVMLLAVDDTGAELRLKAVDGPQASTSRRINAPIQERSRSEPAPRLVPVRLLDYLGSVPSEHRRPDLDSRIEGVAAWLMTFFSEGGRSQDVLAGYLAVLQEATSLVQEIVDRRGAAIPGYGEVAVLLYEFVYEFSIKSRSDLLAGAKI